MEWQKGKYTFTLTKYPVSIMVASLSWHLIIYLFIPATHQIQEGIQY